MTSTASGRGPTASARIVWTLISLLLGTSSGDLHAQLIKGPYLIYAGVNTEMQVLWQLAGTESCLIEWGEDTAYGGGSHLSEEYGVDHQHAYTISGLAPGTHYHYRVTHGSGSFATGSFRMAPASNAANVKFLAYGDTRTYPADHDAVNAEMVNTYVADSEYQTFTLHAGDWVGSGDSETGWATEFFDPSRLSTRELQANLPIQGCRGNHEQTGTLYAKYWPYPYPSPGGFYWSFDYGPVHVAVVDQYVDYLPGSAQYTWLESDLISSTKPWKVILLHEPGWSAGGTHPNEAAVQDHIQPLCLAHGVQIVFAGHNHYYARCEVDGVTHLTIGGGGAPLRAVDPSYPNVVTAASVFHFCEIDIQAGVLTATVRGIGGSVVDSFVMELDSSEVDHYALGETLGAGNVYGTFTDTQSSDDVYEIIEERHSGGKPANRYSYLEHGWTFDVTAGYQTTFFLEAHRSAVVDPDDFVFSYSTDNLNYIPMVTVTKTVDDGLYQTCALPASTSGAIYVRLEDTDRTPGNLSFDTISIDDMFIRVSSAPAPPGVASNPMPVAGAANVPLATVLSWTAGAQAQVHDICFGTSSPPPFIGSQAGTSFDPGPLQANTVYYWSVDEVNGVGVAAGPVWSFTTGVPCSATTLHVESIDAGVISGTKGRKFGAVTVLVQDDCGNPIPMAQVAGSFTGDYVETLIATTDAVGVAHFVTTYQVKRPSYTFHVDGMIDSGGSPPLLYDPNQNTETSESY